VAAAVAVVAVPPDKFGNFYTYNVSPKLPKKYVS